MPIYMDRHDVSEEVTAEHVAHLHSHDLNIQDQYGCKALTYWFDDNRKTAFCLVEAPSKAAMIAMHDAAHGKIPSEIIEVDKRIVESFLGRIEDPEKAVNNDLNIINDPAFRTIVVVKPDYYTLSKSNVENKNMQFTAFRSQLQERIVMRNGRVVRADIDELLLSFTSVSEAIAYATSIKDKFGNVVPLAMGVSGGVPVTPQNGFFEKAISEAGSMCMLHAPKILITKEVADLYESENEHRPVDAASFLILQNSEVQFLMRLVEVTKANYKSEFFKSSDFCKALGFSKSHFYRMITANLRRSPNQFLKSFRLEKSLSLLQSVEKNIAEVAFLVGFKSQSNFSKSFQKQFGLSPTGYRTAMNKH